MKTWSILHASQRVISTSADSIVFELIARAVNIFEICFFYIKCTLHSLQTVISVEMRSVGGRYILFGWWNSVRYNKLTLLVNIHIFWKIFPLLYIHSLFLTISQVLMSFFDRIWCHIQPFYHLWRHNLPFLSSLTS